MAVSWKIAIMLIALVVGGGIYAMADVGVGQLEEPVRDNADTQETQKTVQWVNSFWTFAPVFIFVAVAIWFVKESVVFQ